MSTNPPKAGPAAVIVPLVGATLVWYDFQLFGALATTISPGFFTKSTPVVTTIAYYSTFATGLIVRPTGAFFLGRVGDLSGRKRALSLTLLITGVATLLMGVLPTYRLIGVAAPVLLLLLRMLQGFAFGGVYAAAVIYAAEHAPDRKRGFFTGLIQTAPTLGLLLSLASVYVVQHTSDSFKLASYGWRMTLLPSVILIGLALYTRRMEETPIYRRVEESRTASERSILDGLRDGSNLKLILTALCVAAGQAALWYMAQFYAMFHLQNVLKVGSSAATRVVVASLLLGLPFFVLFGALSDRFGRKKFITSGCLLAAVLYVPIYAGMQRAAGTHVVSISPARNSVTGAHGPTSMALIDGVLKPAAESADANLIALTALVFLQTVLLAMVSGPLGAYFAEAFRPKVRCTSTAVSYSAAHGVVGSLLPVFSLPLLATTGDIYAGLYYAMAVALVSFLAGVFTLKETVTRAPGA